MFKEITKEDLDGFNDRLQAIKGRSKRGYIDDGPVALYHALWGLRAKGALIVFVSALEEAERLYGIEDKGNKNAIE